MPGVSNLLRDAAVLAEDSVVPWGGRDPLRIRFAVSVIYTAVHITLRTSVPHGFHRSSNIQHTQCPC